MKKRISIIFLIFAIACQPVSKIGTPVPSAPPLTPTEAIETAVITLPVSTPTVTPRLPTATATLQSLPPFTIDFTKPFAPETTLNHWTEAPYGGEEITLPVNLSKTANQPVISGLTTLERNFLSQNGFVVINSQEAQFGDIREEVANEEGQPYYLTVDAAYHALHLQFDELLKALEREQFSAMVKDITSATLDEVLSYLPQVKGTSLENEVLMSAAYLSVGMKLLDPDAAIDTAVTDITSQQIVQIMSYAGRDKSVLFTKFGSEFEDDYGAYRPVGHYAGDPPLEQYFRAMTWYGRVNFRLIDGSRVPVIVTNALRHARINGEVASDMWALLHRALTFMIGPSDDSGPLEYSALMDQIYGNLATVMNLTDEATWAKFQEVGKTELPAPKINSTFVNFIAELPNEKGWRFMGQRFTMDEYIIQNLIYDSVEETADHERRGIPTGADVMGVLGSASGREATITLGATKFPNFLDQFNMLQQAAAAQPESEWLGCSYCAWLYSFFPVVAPKGQAFPAYMRTNAWGYKDLNAALGSWAELKHDTILYTKMAEGAGGGGLPSSPKAPSYVEPNPEAFLRMAFVAGSLANGLSGIMQQYPGTGGSPGLTTDWLLYGMNDLSDRLAKIGQMAADELAGIPLPEEDRGLITECLGMIECMNRKTAYNRPESEMPRMPIVAAVSGYKDEVLEAATGYVDRIYVIIPLENRWEIAQGGVYSYYEFNQPRSARLTDEQWRNRLDSGNAPSMPQWASEFLVPGGNPVSADLILFRIGDVYMVTPAGDHLYLYENSSTGSNVLAELRKGDYVKITDGPAIQGLIYWKFKRLFCADFSQDCTEVEGWAVEKQEWYDRLPQP
jgi:hypothetical protein